MLPSARNGMGAKSTTTRGRSGAFGEGRQMSSRSSSCDSSESEHSPEDVSDDEDRTSVSRMLTGNSSIVRGFQSEQSQAQSTNPFGRGEGSAFLSNQAKAAGMQLAPSPFSAPSTFSAPALALPSKIFRGGSGGPFSAFASNSAMSSGSTAATRSNGRRSSMQSADAISASNAQNAPAQNGDHLTMPMQGLMPGAPPSDPRDLQGSTNGIPLSNNGTAGEQTSNALISTEGNASSNQSNNVIEQSQAPSTVAPVGTSQNASNIRISQPQPVVSLFNFLTAPVQYPGTTGLNLPPSSPSAGQGAPRTHAASLPPALGRNIEGANARHPVSRTPDNDYQYESDNSITPTAKAAANKKRKLKQDEERKRGTFRLHNYPGAPSAPDQTFSTLPGKPAFTAHEPVTTGATPLPLFQYTEPRDRRKQTSTNQYGQEDAGPSGSSNGTAPVGNAHGSADGRSFGDSCDYNTGYPYEGETDVSTYADTTANHPTPQDDATGTSQLPAAFTELGLSYASTALLDQQAFPQSEDHLVSIIIEDARFGAREPSLVELILPLRPDGNGAYWLDAIALCTALQSGPSRIDGPAKVYAFRNRFRQYFLRVSPENMDNYAPANLSVPADLVLKVMVESMMPLISHHPSQVLTQPTAPLNPHYAHATRLRQLLLATVEDGTSKSNPPPPRPTLLIKRRRDQSPETVPKNAVPPTNTTNTDSGPSANRGPTQPSTTDDAPRPSYYRKRAL